MLTLLVAAVVLGILAWAIMAVVDAIGRAGRAIARIVLAICVAGFAVASGALASLAVDQYLGELSLLGLAAGRWAGIATTCLLLGSAAYRYARDDEPATMTLAPREYFAVRPTEAGPPVPRAARGAGPWWSPAARRARKQARDDRARWQAWDEVADRADWAAARISVARSACESLLEALSGDAGQQGNELAIALRRRVPEIISEAVERCRGASLSEQRELLDEAVTLLEILAAEAERQRATTRPSSSPLATKRAYVEEVVRRSRLA
jgi:hypothetical protein